MPTSPVPGVRPRQIASSSVTGAGTARSRGRSVAGMSNQGRIYEQHGVVFHFCRTATGAERGSVVLQDGERLDADFTVAGVGARPTIGIAQQAGLPVDNRVMDARMETAAPGAFAVGDAARWANPRGWRPRPYRALGACSTT